MPELDGQLGQRLATLERQVESLSTSAERQRATIAGSHAAQQIRMAKTWSDDPLTYPATGNTFEILFQDISVALPTTAGSRTVTRTNRSTLVLDLATSVDGAYLPRGSYVAVAFKNNHWWILGSIRENEGLVSYKEWTIVYEGTTDVIPPAPPNTITGRTTYATSVSDVEESGDVGVSWDGGGPNWLVDTAGVIGVGVEVGFNPYVFVDDNNDPYEWREDANRYRQSKNSRLQLIIDRSTGVGDSKPDRGAYDEYWRDNFSDHAPRYPVDGVLRVFTTASVIAGNRIRTWVNTLDKLWGFFPPTSVTKQENIFEARLYVLRFNDMPTSVAVAGGLTYYIFDEPTGDQIIDEPAGDELVAE